MTKIAIYLFAICITISCSRFIKNKSNLPPLEFNVKILDFYNDNDEVDYTQKFCAVFYEVKNNTSAPIYFNKMNFFMNVTDTNGVMYEQGFFKSLFNRENYDNGCVQCKINAEYDIYPMSKSDTLKNIVKINAHSFYSDTLRAYGYNYLRDESDKKDNLPLCYKKLKDNKAHIKFQLLYDNTKQDVRMDTVWKGKMFSNIVVWQ